MNLKNIFLVISLICVAEGLKQLKPIARVAVFPTMKGQTRVDLATYDPSLVKIVDPIPIATMVEVLKLSSDETLRKFKSAHSSALKGSKTLISMSFAEQAQDYYNRLLQDWMPMNEAESAAAKYLLSVSSCAIRNTKEMGEGVTACQYHGTKILSDIINRLVPLNNLLTLGTVEPISDMSKTINVNLDQPPELKAQMATIVKLFAGEETTRVLGIVSPNLVKIWENICKNVQNNIY